MVNCCVKIPIIMSITKITMAMKSFLLDMSCHVTSYHTNKHNDTLYINYLNNLSVYCE